jgi:hypothetical protein
VGRLWARCGHGGPGVGLTRPSSLLTGPSEDHRPLHNAGVGAHSDARSRCCIQPEEPDHGREPEKKAVPAAAVWDLREASFQEGVNEVKKYRLREGHCLIPANYVTDDGYKLGQFVSVRRTSKANGTLSDEHVKQLEAIKGWAWKIRGVKKPA